MFRMRSATHLNGIVGGKVITTQIHVKLVGRSVFTSYHMIYYHLKTISAPCIVYQSMNIIEPCRIEVQYWQWRVLEPIISTIYLRTLNNWQVIYKVKLLLEIAAVRSVINSFDIVCLLADLNTVHRIIVKIDGNSCNKATYWGTNRLKSGRPCSLEVRQDSRIGLCCLSDMRVHFYLDTCINENLLDLWI